MLLNGHSAVRSCKPSLTPHVLEEREVAKQEAHALRQVQRRANETLAAIRATATALAAAEAAVDAVERAKGQPDDPVRLAPSHHVPLVAGMCSKHWLGLGRQWPQ